MDQTGAQREGTLRNSSSQYYSDYASSTGWPFQSRASLPAQPQSQMLRPFSNFSDGSFLPCPGDQHSGHHSGRPAPTANPTSIFGPVNHQVEARILSTEWNLQASQQQRSLQSGGALPALNHLPNGSPFVEYLRTGSSGASRFDSSAATRENLNLGSITSTATHPIPLAQTHNLDPRRLHDSQRTFLTPSSSTTPRPSHIEHDSGPNSLLEGPAETPLSPPLERRRPIFNPRTPRQALEIDSQTRELHEQVRLASLVESQGRWRQGGVGSTSTAQSAGSGRLVQSIRRFSDSFTSKVPVKVFLKSLARVDVNDLPESERMCNICYEPLGVTNPEGVCEAPLRLPKCQHVFGDCCLNQWLADADSCPYCRQKFPIANRVTIADAIRRLRELGIPLQDILHKFQESGHLPSDLTENEAVHVLSSLADGDYPVRQAPRLVRRSPPDDAAENRRRTRRRLSPPDPPSGIPATSASDGRDALARNAIEDTLAADSELSSRGLPTESQLNHYTMGQGIDEDPSERVSYSPSQADSDVSEDHEEAVYRHVARYQRYGGMQQETTRVDNHSIYRSAFSSGQIMNPIAHHRLPAPSLTQNPTRARAPDAPFIPNPLQTPFRLAVSATRTTQQPSVVQPGDVRMGPIPNHGLASNGSNVPFPRLPSDEAIEDSHDDWIQTRLRRRW